MKKVVLSLGSNLGDRELYLDQAISSIQNRVGKVLKKSAVYETKSWGFDSFDFLNQVIIIQTDCMPIELLDILQDIEKELGRVEKSRMIKGKMNYQPRTIDLDILFYEDLSFKNDRLTIPHPNMGNRDFIIKPLKELGINVPLS
ncbi:MAG: 2-amino-4-hydroxy-6-hydroxymethyldihydropteridine diphosphokinase [Bacteroidales bacterium]